MQYTFPRFTAGTAFNSKSGRSMSSAFSCRSQNFRAFLRIVNSLGDAAVTSLAREVCVGVSSKSAARLRAASARFNIALFNVSAAYCSQASCRAAEMAVLFLAAGRTAFFGGGFWAASGAESADEAREDAAAAEESSDAVGECRERRAPADFFGDFFGVFLGAMLSELRSKTIKKAANSNDKTSNRTATTSMTVHHALAAS
jgi:hypothetical protein